MVDGRGEVCLDVVTVEGEDERRERRLLLKGGQAEQDWDWKSSRIMGCCVVGGMVYSVVWGEGVGCGLEVW